MPVHLHMTPFVSKLRAYSEADGYKRRIPYEAILTVVHESDTHVYLSEAVGTINMATWDAAMVMLKAQGIKTVQYERRGRMKTRKL